MHSIAVPFVSLQPICEWCGLKIVGDNIDKHVRCRQMRLDRQNKSLHYFHSFAVKDRVNLHDVSDIPPTTTPSISTVLPKLLPSKDDDAVIYDDFAILLARMMCDNMPYFKENYGDVVERHIPHKHQEEMSARSEVVSTVYVQVCMSVHSQSFNSHRFH